MIWALHGAVGMAADWEEFAQRMAVAGHEVRAVDLWEFVAEGACSFAEFGEALGGRVAAEDPEPVLLGYSLGGRLALHALLAEPSRWKAGVIVSAHPGLRDDHERLVRMAEDAQWAAHALTADWKFFLAKWNGQGVLREAMGSGLGDRELLEPRRGAVARGFMEWSLGKQDDLRGRLGEIGSPLLWVTGERDEKFTVLARELAPGDDPIRFEAVAGAGHRVPWERPEEFCALVREFLAAG